jgi:pimeloyl-ACP methyl ester carboxylesterase
MVVIFISGGGEKTMSELHRRRVLMMAAAAPLFASRAAAQTAAPGIDEQGFVRVGGIDQWIAIQGRNAANPAILYLHGGPAEAQSPFLKTFAPWEQDFTVVNWDQRGSGKTYGRNGPSTPDMTLERMVQDAIEVAEHARRRLGKARLILVGQSWGALLGLNVVKQRPDLFGAFVGTAQPVSWALSLQGVERFARAQASAAGDQAAIKALDDAETLPIDDMRRMMASRRWRMAPSDLEYLKLQADFTGPPPPPTTGDVADWLAGGAYTIPKLLPVILHFDITSLGDFALPIVLIEGRDDHITSPPAARDWLDHVRAPAKAFVPIDGGHYACFTNAQAFVAALKSQVLPVARGV